MTQHDTPSTEPKSIGPYKILSVLGEGGMGVVYLAEQTSPVRRRVALKLLKLGMDTKQVVARFDSERQALAVMDHPNIAKVLDSGVTGDGRPFFVMELVHGTPITDYADTHRLTTSERLHLFVDVCHAVQHAHHKGVIHRDLKPSNVLIAVHDAGPAVKVIDFGIAKAVGIGLTDQTLVTRAGQILGTPEYMSPEQAEMSGLDVDTRTDIYSLGVMLYELIAGVRPFDLASKPDYAISHTIREREVPRPSTRLTELGSSLPAVARHRRTTPESLRKELRGDLDWIVLKAMDKDRTRRYDTANGLAMDVQRHLNHEPVVARPPSATDRIGKFVRRNRTGVLAGAFAMIALLVGAAAATLGFLHAREEQRRAEQSATTAQQATDFLIDVFRVSDPGEARGNTITAREVLDRGADRIQAELVDQPAVQATLMRAIGHVYANLGLHDAATPLLERAVLIAETTNTVDDMELASALQLLGIAYRRQGRSDSAEHALRRALDLTRRADGEPPTAEFANTARSLANVYSTLGRYGDAEPLLREALSIQERLLGPDHPDVGLTLGNLAVVHLSQRKSTEAEPYLRRAIAITERQFGADHPYVAEELVNLGASFYMQGRYEEAEQAYQRAYPIMEAALGPDHPDVARVLNNLGEIRWAQTDYLGAEEKLRRSLDIKERVLGPEHASVAFTLKALGSVYRDQGRYEEADPLYVRALRIYDQALQSPDASVRETLEAYARLLRLQDRNEEAEAMEARAAAIGSAFTN